MPELRDTVTEDVFQAVVIDVARLFGWRVAHFRPGRTATGWRTAVSGDGAGFPDLVLVRPGRVLFRELKVGRGELRADQAAWRDALLDAHQDWALWRPSDWERIERELRTIDVAGGR